MTDTHQLKISIITVAYNAAATIEHCIRSIAEQDYPLIEHIIIDGGSTDGTLDIINKYRDHIAILVSGPDRGIYDAMNKGISLATGDVVGTLNADDRLADTNIIGSVATLFAVENAEIVYGNLVYVNQDQRTSRIWNAGKYFPGVYNWGWMSPHPTFYCRRELFEVWGLYSLNYGSAADYELMLRFMHQHTPRVAYLNKVMVKMLPGGVSNKNIGNYVKAWRNDFRAMQKCGIRSPLLTIILKPLRKIGQVLKL